MSEEQLAPDQLRRDNWALFVHARSHDPSVKVPYTRELVSSLINTMRILEEHRYDGELADCDEVAVEAMRIYSDDWKEAAIRCGDILNQIGHLLYDRQYAIPTADSFKGSVKGEPR